MSKQMRVRMYEAENYLRWKCPRYHQIELVSSDYGNIVFVVLVSDWGKVGRGFRRPPSWGTLWPHVRAFINSREVLFRKFA